MKRVMKKGTVEKISFLDNPHVPKEKSFILEGEKFTGYFTSEPKVGECFLLTECDDDIFFFKTSVVKSVFKPNSDQDKLVIPTNFEMKELLNIPEVNEDEILFITMNSLYLLSGIKEFHCED
jgi:hypothetical protein